LISQRELIGPAEGVHTDARLGGVKG
jgi:hypothetical protein